MFRFDPPYYTSQATGVSGNCSQGQILTFHQGYSPAHNNNLTFYQYLSVNPEKSKRFAGGMQASGKGPDISPSFLVRSFQWASLGAGTVVDMGGFNGSVSRAIAEVHPALKFIVQDRPKVINATNGRDLSHRVVDRIEFMAHDFFTDQSVVADLYLFRYIFHNWLDANANRILRHLIPRLKSGARVLVNDHLLPEPTTASLTTEREAR